MANEERKVRYGIKGKLISAIAMLMVAVIMTVSSTYAWFTLSTAPEVTGISTAVGANGALEMLLLAKNADGTWSYMTGADVYGDKNTTWGNLVDLSDNAVYGTDKVVLYPAQLNTSLPGKVNMDSPLNYPEYGPDGRVDSVTGQTMVSGGYGTTGSFVENTQYGYRAVGATSGLSAREIALRAATSSINVLKNQAQGKAELSLTDNGSTLADMAIQKVLVDAPVFGVDHYNAVASMIEGLEATLDLLDEAYQQAILAWAASNATSADDTVYNAVKAIVDDNANYADIEAVVAAVEAKFTEWQETILDLTGESVTLSLPTWIVGDPADGDNTALEQFKTMKTDVETAATRLAALLPENATEPEANAEFTYAEMTNALQPLVNMSSLMVNDLPLSEKDAIMSSALTEREVWVSMSSGAGVYADVADQCGSYMASIKVDAGSLLGASEEILMDAEMRATTTLGTNAYLQVAIDEVKAVGAPANEQGESPFSEYYGYIVDLAFRTNAAASNLLLQQEGVDRIYSDNNNETTMGKGSTMTFGSTTTSFSTESVKDLMRHIRIIFFSTDGENEIYAYAKLDVDNATVANGQVTAAMYIYEMVEAYNIAEIENVTVYQEGEKYYLDAEKTKEVTVKEGTTPTDDGEGNLKAIVTNLTVFRGEPVETTTGEGEEAVTTTTYNYYTDYYTQDESTLIYTTTDAAADTQIRGENDANVRQIEVTRDADDEKFGVITPLTQNAIKHVSALVYLDGQTIQNSDVAAEAASSMTGTTNFQFASDANLVPMEYGDLHTPNATEATNP